MEGKSATCCMCRVRKRLCVCVGGGKICDVYVGGKVCVWWSGDLEMEQVSGWGGVGKEWC